MKVSESWLREWVNPSLTSDELAAQITMAGLEVDAIEPVAEVFSGVVVGEIVAIEQHPDADKLRVCQVKGQDGSPVQVVCGAPNARKGIKIPFATVGAVLPGNFKIKKAKLRGVESFGMLCAQTELKLGEDDDGLWELALDAPVGEDLRDYLSLNDVAIDVDLTPNRSDCLSIKGIAREVAVLNRLAVTAPQYDMVTPVNNDTFSVKLSATDACPRYVGRIIKNVDHAKSTPLWMQERLRRAGLNSKDIVVDTTNYVLLEMGQPMHAFDLAKLSGGIDVRYAKQGESLELLNGQTVELDSDTLVIADAEKPLAMAGIMGGQASAVSESTKDILLESAFFAPTAIAGRSRRYGLHTDSSHRFERGVDYALQEEAIERATQLIVSIAGGESGPLFSAEAEHELLKTRTVNLRRARIEKNLGFAMPDSEVVDILTRLGLTMLDETPEGWSLSIPSYRFDISIEADLMEELARVYGYNNLPTTDLKMSISLPRHTEAVIGIQAIKSHLVSRDYQEAVCYSFVEPELQALMDPSVEAVKLQNPISADMAVMRTSLLQSLVGALQHNLNRQQTRVRLFETGLRFVPDSAVKAKGIAGVKQQAMVAGLIYGPRQDESWMGKSEKVDFYDLKGDIESLFAITRLTDELSYSPAEHPVMHPGQTAAIHLNGQVVGYLGAIHPQLQKALSLPQTAFMFEIEQSALGSAVLPRFAPLSKFPEVRRDLAVVVDQTITSQQLLDEVKAAGGEFLSNLKIFDVYVGEGIDSHRKSVALGLTFQALSRTLAEDDINQAMDAIIKALTQSFNAELR